MICRDPGEKTTFSRFKSQTARFLKVDGQAVRENLNADLRFICTEDTPERAFWIYWGTPFIETQFGILCFGNFELRHNRVLEITALSDKRMKILLEIAGGLVGSIKPRRKYDKTPKIRKPRKGKG